MRAGNRTIGCAGLLLTPAGDYLRPTLRCLRGQNSRATLLPTAAPSPIPPVAKPAPTPAAGCQACETIPAPILPEMRPSATVFPRRLVLGTMKVLFTAYLRRGH